MSGVLSARGPSLARPQAALAAVLLLLAALAWWDTARRMGSMPSTSPVDLGGLAFYTGLWVVMMAAMMFPSIAPMIVVYDRLRAARRAQSHAAPGIEGTVLFVGGYLAVWTAAGVVAYAVIALFRWVDPAALGWDRAGRHLVAGIVLAGAAYQVTPLKQVCLRHCRGPLSFVLEHWRSGRGGALRMGVVHGAWCVGCCWALMATLFALGVMSLGWMAFVAALIAAEKLLPREPSFLVAGALLLLGLAILIAPDAVPGLPDGGMAPMDMDAAQAGPARG